MKGKGQVVLLHAWTEVHSLICIGSFMYKLLTCICCTHVVYNSWAEDLANGEIQQQEDLPKHANHALLCSDFKKVKAFDRLVC
jgi:hypothetical protein